MKATAGAASVEKILRSAHKAVLTVADIQRLTGAPPGYLRLALHRAQKRGFITRIERGKYCHPETHPFAVASNLVYPSYLSFLSALSYHELTDQLPSTLTVASAKHRGPLVADMLRVDFIPLPPRRMFGYLRINLGGHCAFVASPEKAIVDSLYLPSRCPLSETYAALRRGRVDPDKLISFAKRMGSIVLLKRLGFLSELAGSALFDQLGGTLNRNIDMLSPGLPARGPVNARWKLRINERIEP